MEYDFHWRRTAVQDPSSQDQMLGRRNLPLKNSPMLASYAEHVFCQIVAESSFLLFLRESYVVSSRKGDQSFFSSICLLVVSELRSLVMS